MRKEPCLCKLLCELTNSAEAPTLYFTALAVFGILLLALVYSCGLRSDPWGTEAKFTIIKMKG